MSRNPPHKAYVQPVDTAIQCTRGRRNFVASALSLGAATALARTALAEPRLAPGAVPGAPADASRRGALPPTAADPKAPVPTATAASSGLEQPALPYSQSALEPYISANTLSVHYGKHHKGYYEKTNALTQATPLAGKPLEQVVKDSARGGKAQLKLFNVAAQAWNHDFYWQSMKPKGGGAPSAELAKRIDKDFGSYDTFKNQFIQTAVDHFSNGWVWLVLDKNKLKIVDTHDADTPLVHGWKPLLVNDVWEHAYYLDYKNLRKDYATAFVEHLLNWELVAQRLG
jgi:Fe-Mn family superoxide dismutase